MKNPRLGIIHQRDAHASAKTLAHLQDPLIAETVLASEIVPLEEALERTWAEDAHFLTYHLLDDEGDPVFARASKRSPFVRQLEEAGGRVAVTVLALDYDLPGHAEWTGDAFDEFVQVLLEGVATYNLPEPSAWYQTLHGARLVYVLDEPTGPQDAEEMLVGLIANWKAAGLEVDPKCRDWTRLFRLPRTTRQDTSEPYDPDIVATGGPVLAVADAPRGVVETVDAYAEVDTEVGERPSPEQVHELLWTKNEKTKKERESKLVQGARLYLKVDGPAPDPPYPFAIIFEDAPLVEGEDHWNSTVLHVVGAVVGRLARLEGVTAQGIYALLHGPLEQLQDRERRGANQTDWLAKGWDMVSRMWVQEQGKIAAEEEVRRAEEARAADLREELIERARVDNPREVPPSREQATEWLMGRLIAVHDRSLYVMRMDGHYNRAPVQAQQLVPQIKDLDMDGVIPITKVQGKSIVTRSAQDLINDHGVPVTRIHYNVDRDAPRIHGEAGERTLEMPLYRLNPSLRPAFSKAVDRWLREFVGKEHYDHLIEWLSHSLDFRRPICALNLWGASGAGKGLLAQGLIECFDSPKRNDGRALGKWNGGLLDNPFIICDEGLPNIANDEGLPIDQAFRALVTGGEVVIRTMQTNPFSARLFPRVLFTSNDEEIIGQIAGSRDLTQQDMIAIQQRLLTLEVRESARQHLVKRGNMRHTADWCQPKGLELANHIAHLYENREEPSGTDRLLVEGALESEGLEAQQFRSGPAQVALRAIMKFLESSESSTGDGFHLYENRLFLTAQGLSEYAERWITRGDVLTVKQAHRVLKHVLALPDERTSPWRPPGNKQSKRRWSEVDLPKVFARATANGMRAENLRRMVEKWENGDQIIREIES
jgi:hypothetical protein